MVAVIRRCDLVVADFVVTGAQLHTRLRQMRSNGMPFKKTP